MELVHRLVWRSQTGLGWTMAGNFPQEDLGSKTVKWDHWKAESPLGYDAPVRLKYTQVKPQGCSWFGHSYAKSSLRTPQRKQTLGWSILPRNSKQFPLSLRDKINEELSFLWVLSFFLLPVFPDACSHRIYCKWILTEESNGWIQVLWGLNTIENSPSLKIIQLSYTVLNVK